MGSSAPSASASALNLFKAASSSANSFCALNKSLSGRGIFHRGSDGRSPCALTVPTSPTNRWTSLFFSSTLFSAAKTSIARLVSSAPSAGVGATSAGVGATAAGGTAPSVGGTSGSPSSGPLCRTMSIRLLINSSRPSLFLGLSAISMACLRSAGRVSSFSNSFILVRLGSWAAFLNESMSSRILSRRAISR